MLGHAFAGMLARIKPDLGRAAAHPQIVNRLTLNALAKLDMGHARCRRDPRDQIVMLLHRIRRKVGEPDNIGFAFMTDR